MSYVMTASPVKWVPLSVIAIEYNRVPAAIRQWCSNGFILELGYSLRKDSTGHWIVGVPFSLWDKFGESAKTAIDDIDSRA
jgi:hypothetical protein